MTLPSQCSNYILDTDATRLVSYGNGSVCDQTVYSTALWVRFGGSATMMVTSPPAVHRCGTYATGWLTGTLPSTAGLTVVGVVCFAWTTTICDFHSQISITNCSGFYVYLLVAPSNCPLRYCTQWTRHALISRIFQINIHFMPWQTWHWKTVYLSFWNLFRQL